MLDFNIDEILEGEFNQVDILLKTKMFILHLKRDASY